MKHRPVIPVIIKFVVAESVKAPNTPCVTLPMPPTGLISVSPALLTATFAKTESAIANILKNGDILCMEPRNSNCS